VAGATVESAGGVPGRTVVVAAVVEVVIVAISVVDGCCSWQRAVTLVRYWSGDGDLRYRAPMGASSIGGVGGLLIFSYVTSVRVGAGISSSLELGDLGLGWMGSSSNDSIVAS
jgi:hypothetical protein